VDYFDFRRSFEQGLSKLKLPPDCSQQEPNWEVVAPPLGWQVEVIFDFEDHKHIRIWESYDKYAGLMMSRKIQWSYNYGVAQVVDEKGRAMRGSPEDPLELRIDTCSGLHMHYQAREPHYAQDKIIGINLQDVEAFSFVRAILKHRKTGKPLTKVLGFRIRGK
jgi:hypothetical protein